MKKFKLGDWVVFGLKIGQITELDEDGMASFSDGFIQTSGRIGGRFRELTTDNKRIAESMATYYARMRSIDGEGGFNYPDICRHFEQLSLEAIDANRFEMPQEVKRCFDAAIEFIQDARDYKAEIQGVRLFRRAAR